MLRRIVALVVHAQHKRRVRPVRRRRDNHFLHCPAQVRLRLLALRKKSRRFHNNVRANARPVNRRRILLLEYFERLAVHRNRVFRVRNRVRQISQNRVVLQKMRQRLRVRHVVHRDKFNILVVQRRPDDISADAAKAVDCYLDGHAASGEICIPVRRSVRTSDTCGTENAMGCSVNCQRNAALKIIYSR